MYKRLETETIKNNKWWRERIKFDKEHPAQYKKEHLEVFMGTEWEDQPV